MKQVLTNHPNVNPIQGLIANLEEASFSIWARLLNVHLHLVSDRLKTITFLLEWL